MDIILIEYYHARFILLDNQLLVCLVDTQLQYLKTT